MITEKLRQGDVLQHSDGRICFVLTPDCDIYNNKFRGAITILQVNPISNYIKNVFFEDEIKRWISEYKMMFMEHKDLSIDEYFFDEYIINDDPDQVFLRYFETAAPKEFKCLQKHIRERGDAEETFLEYCKLKKIKPGKRIKSCLKSLSLDFFFINQVPSVPEFGYIIDLRMPEAIAEDSIILSKSEIYQTELSSYYIKLGSMPDSIRFGVAQSFAFLFSRIGMPTDFELERDQIFMLFEEHYE